MKRTAAGADLEAMKKARTETASASDMSRMYAQYQQQQGGYSTAAAATPYAATAHGYSQQSYQGYYGQGYYSTAAADTQSVASHQSAQSAPAYGTYNAGYGTGSYASTSALPGATGAVGGHQTSTASAYSATAAYASPASQTSAYQQPSGQAPSYNAVAYTAPASQPTSYQQQSGQAPGYNATAYAAPANQAGGYQQPAGQSAGFGAPHASNQYRPSLPPSAPAAQFYGPARPMMPAGAGGPQVPNRTVYIGNLEPGVTVTEILDIVKGGMLDNIKLVADKNCAFISFVDSVGASLFLQEVTSNPMSYSIRNRPVKIGWARPPPPIPASLATAISQGASRSIYMGHIPDVNDFTAEQVANDLSEYGTVDTVRLIPERHVMFAHMSSIQEAMDALSALKQREPYMNLRLNFAKERCDRSINPVTQAKSPNNPFEGTMSSSMAVSLAGQPPVPRDQRCLYIGGLTEDMTAEDLSQAIRAGGPVFYIKMMPAKMCAFVSFVEASSAYILFAYSNAPSGGLFVKGRRVRVSWAKNYILPHDAIDAIRQGATRNLYLGNIDLETMTRESITADFAAFGEVEQVVVLPEKNTAFINFCALMDAVNALTAFRTGTGIGEKYAQCRLNYGRDRCALEPRNLPGILADYRQHCDKMSAMGMQAPPLSFQGRPPMPPGPMSGPPPRPMDGTGSQPPVAYNNYGNAPPPMQQGFNNYAGQPPANYNNYGSNQQIVGEVKGQ